MPARCTAPDAPARLARYEDGGVFLGGFTMPILTASATAQRLFDLVRAAPPCSHGCLLGHVGGVMMQAVLLKSYLGPALPFSNSMCNNAHAATAILACKPRLRRCNTHHPSTKP